MELLDIIQQGCGLGLDVSVSRQSRDPLRPRPRLRGIDERLGLGLRIKGLGLGIGLGPLGHVHTCTVSRASNPETNQLDSDFESRSPEVTGQNRSGE